MYLVGRIGARSVDPAYFGSWRLAPPWARVLFGSSEGSINPYKLSTGLAGLALIAGGLAIVATGDPPGPPLGQVLASLMLVALAGWLACWIVVWVGQTLRAG
jgi:hypothetical protein